MNTCPRKPAAKLLIHGMYYFAACSCSIKSLWFTLEEFKVLLAHTLVPFSLRVVILTINLLVLLR